MSINIEVLSPDDRFDIEVWFVLQKIKKYSKYRSGGQDIEYRIYSPPNIRAEGMPFPVEELKILKLLVERKAIDWKDPRDRIETFETVLSRRGGVAIAIAYLDFSTNFKHVYKEFEEKYEKIKLKFHDEDFTLYFGFDDKTFWLKRAHGAPATINFYPQEDEGTGPFYLMSAFVHELKSYGKTNGGWFEATIKRDRLAAYIRKHWPSQNDLNEQWFKHTKGNLIKKIPIEHRDLIKINYYDRKLSGYPFALKIPS